MADPYTDEERTDLPSRESIVERLARAIFVGFEEEGAVNFDFEEWRDDYKRWRDDYERSAAAALDALTLLDLAAEMQRRGARVTIWPRDHGQSPNDRVEIILWQEDTAE